jgi:hypothetical protein
MKALALYAGPAAKRWIEKNGLSPQDVAAVAAAAGGPKGLILGALDRMIFGHWLAGSHQPVHLLGASIGAWRMAAACLPHPEQAFSRLEHDYIHQDYELEPGQKRPRATHVSERFGQSLQTFFGDQLSALLANPRYRLHLITARGRHVLRKERKFITPMAFAGTFGSNLLHRRGLGWWLERVVFSNPLAALPFAPDGMPTRQIALNSDNFMPAVQASCSIPFVLDAVQDIPGAPKGAYWDGGLIDYHLHLDYRRLQQERSGAGLVLYPHFQKAVVPGWLDKSLAWRHKATPYLDNLLVLAPRREWVARLPNAKLPDRTDFVAYGNHFDGRVTAWQTACCASRQLADEFDQWLARPDPAQVQAL